MSIIRILYALPQRCAILAIGFYRNFLSGLMLPRCRFHPTCSAYAHEAFCKKGFIKGALLSARRLMRCHPFNRGFFYDPVK
jgi:putative membrane protein insertion efficiency factor